MAERDNKGPTPPRWARFSKIAAAWVLIATIPIVLIQMRGAQEVGEQFPFSKFRQEVERGNVARVVFIDGQAIEGELRAPVAGTQGGQVSRFQTQLPIRDSELLVQE